MSRFDNQHHGESQEKEVIIKKTAENLSRLLVAERSQGRQPEVVRFGEISVSIQASSFNYSIPRSDTAEAYTAVELGFPSANPPDYIMKYAEDPDNPTRTVYSYTPIELVARWIVENGGLKEPSAKEVEIPARITESRAVKPEMTPDEIMEKLRDPGFLPTRDQIKTALKDGRSFQDFCFKSDSPVFEFLNEEYLNAFADYFIERARRLGKKEGDPLVVLEIGAGNGRLTHFLQQKLDERVSGIARVIATDSNDWELKTSFPVEQLRHDEAMKKYSPDVVVFSWMPYQQDSSKDIRKIASVQEYILIGEIDGGCCGDEWETWGRQWNFGDEDDDGHGKTPLYEVDGFTREDLDDLSDLQICRTDYSVGNGSHSRTVSFKRAKR